jgi:uncharacterized membrane protein
MQLQYRDEANKLTREFIKGEILGTTTSDREESFNPLLNVYPDYKVKLQNGEEVQVFSNSIEYKNGTRVYIQKETLDTGDSYYILNEKVRTTELYGSIIFFVLFVLLIFGKKGLKSLLSLASSFAIILFILLPLTLKGYNPVLIAGFISALLLSSMMLITNGRNKITYSALIGCSFSIIVTILLSYFIINYSAISGRSDDLWAYFTFTVQSQINFSLLVIASMIIGVIGAVDDGAITQASVVAELKKANSKLSNLEYYKRAMRVGRDHAGAMINTLVLAYVGSSLPLLMYVYLAPIPTSILINQEMIIIEIFRSIIGSVGLLLAIPITTLVAVHLIKDKDLHDLDYHTHGHSH